MNKAIKLLSAIALAAAFTGCASQANIHQQEQRVADCKASGGKLDWDEHRIKRCVYPSIEDNFTVSYNVARVANPRGAQVVKAR